MLHLIAHILMLLAILAVLYLFISGQLRGPAGQKYATSENRPYASSCPRCAGRGRRGGE